MFRTTIALALLITGVMGVMPAHAAPGPNNTTITVNKGGDRTTSQTVGGIAGAVFDFYDGGATAPSPGAPGAVASCTTIADGKCSVDLPGRTGTGAGYWIVERTAPSGFSAPGMLDVGGNSTTPTNYNGIFTGNVSNNVAYNFPLASTNNTNLTARGSSWADIRDNPPLPGHCGLRIALLIDVSGSIGAAMPQVKNAANGFVDALTGTPSSIALYSFSTNATANLAPTSVSESSGADTVKAAVNALGPPSGGTNWDAGLFLIAAAPETYDAVIMLTDGNPTFYGPPPVAGPGNLTRFREIENGIFSANAVKVLGTKIVAVGVGAGITGSVDNLKAISGPVSGTDYVQTDYPALAQVFHDLALRTCAGTISVVKKVIPPGGVIADGVPTGGWTFSTATPNVTPAAGETAGDTGAVSFKVDNFGGLTSVPVTITETQQPGYTLVQDAGKNATCTNGANPAPSTNDGVLGFTVSAVQNQIISCVVYNRAPIPPASVIVNKTWRINGTEYPNPAQPADFQSQLDLTGETDPVWGQTYTSHVAGENITIGETIDRDKLPPGCTNTPSGDLGGHTLAAGLNTYTVLNTVTCETKLTLVKQIVNPYGPPEAPLTAWTLKATEQGSGTPTMSGPTGITSIVTPDKQYILAESTVPGYKQEVKPEAVLVPGATGSWHCTYMTRVTAGPAASEFDGLNGHVTVELGGHAICTAKNLPIQPKLTLKKSVSNTNGGTAKPADWILNADPATRNTGGEPISGRDGEAAVTSALAIPHIVYTLSENSGPANYDQAGIAECVKTGTTEAYPAPDSKLTLGFGDDVTCTFTNQDKALPPVPPLPVTGMRTAAIVQVGGILVLSGLALMGFVRWWRRRLS